MKKVLIKWLDINTVFGKISESKAKKIKPIELETIGQLVFENEDLICIARDSEKTTDTFRYFTVIPRQVIKKINYLSDA